jgi:hypothetical protein
MKAPKKNINYVNVLITIVLIMIIISFYLVIVNAKILHVL